MPPSKMEKVLNHVRCEACGRAARPNILMFDDDDWVGVPAGHYKRFAKEALAAVNKSGAKLVVLEGGCGKRVPTVRLNSEKLVKHGAELVRINLDYASNSKGASKTVSLAINVLAALQGIDMAIRRLRGVE